MKKKVYIEGNKPATDVAKLWFNTNLYEIVDPIDVSKDLVKILGHAPDIDDDIIYQFYALRSCDLILLLPGWEKSEVSKLKYNFAKHIGVRVLDFNYLPINGRSKS